MSSESWSRNSERRWRHLSNWLWLAPVVWSFIGGTWYAITKNLEGPAGVMFVPWWVLVGGILCYVLATIRARWGARPVIILLTTGLIVGVGMWFLAGIHAALWSGLITPLLLGSGCLRIPPWESCCSRPALIAVVLGTLEPLLILSCVLATTLLIIHYGRRELPGWYWWWVVGGVSTVLLIWSSWLQRHWRRHARSTRPAVPESDHHMNTNRQ